MAKGASKVAATSGPPPMDPRKSYVNPMQEDQMLIQGYVVNYLKMALTWCCIVLTAGPLWLVFHWKPEWMLWCTHTRCELERAQKVLLRDQYQQWFVHRVTLMTKDGTRVEVVSASSSLFNRTGPGRKVEGTTCLQQEVEGRTKLILVAQMEESLIRYFINKKNKYLWNSYAKSFIKLRGMEADISCHAFHASTGLTELEQARKLVLYDENSIIVKVTPIAHLIVSQVLNPFYVFQVFSCTLWYFDEYYYYASCIVIMSALSISSYIYNTRRAQKKLRETIQGTGLFNVYREPDVWEEIPSQFLVPGDVIEVPRNGCIMMCDAVLVYGNCIVNESMLTGESVPITKTPIPDQNDLLNLKDHSRNILFSGTQVVQTRYYKDQKVRGVVIRTGFMTSKGELVRSILFPKPMDFRFTNDTYKFVGVLAGIAAIGFFYTIILMVLDEEQPGHIAKRSLDLITIGVPPAFPAALTIVTIFAQNNLKSNNIYCINPSNIPVCGSINVVCFDKTGTLTEEGMDMWGVVPVLKNLFLDVVRVVSTLDRCPILRCMAACHSLTVIDGQLCGDPLELKMFETTEWELDEPGEHETSRFDVFAPTVVRPKLQDVKQPFGSLHQDAADPHETADRHEIGIVRQFSFTSSLQRMSVIAMTLGEDHYCLYTKGAPEMIVSLSQDDSVPDNFHDVLHQYTALGYRVIALAWKPLPVNIKYLKTQKISRDHVEKDLMFLGLLVFENRLKPETTPIIHQLKHANIRTIMITGDNMLTALSVARECQMVDSDTPIIMVSTAGTKLEFLYNHTDTTDYQSTKVWMGDDTVRYRFAMTGTTWAGIQHNYAHLIPKLITRGVVFARMSPEQKAQVIEKLQELGYYVAMCGDGANDCGALKMAHTGISLSEAEASLACPFTSMNANIDCVPIVMKEGRSSLTTTFGIFKYMACYSLTQFLSVTMLYWIGSNLTDFQFLYIDLILLTSLCITFSRTQPYGILVKKPAPVSLLSFHPILSMIAQTLVQGAFQVGIFIYVRVQPWFEPYVDSADDYYWSHENTAIFCLSSFQYISLAVIFSKGAPYRKTLFSNYVFLLNLLLMTLLTVYITIESPEWLSELLELRYIPNRFFRMLIVFMALANLMTSLVVESYILDNEYIRNIGRTCVRSCEVSSKYEYVNVEKELLVSVDWPPLSSTDYVSQLMPVGLTPPQSIDDEANQEPILPQITSEVVGSLFVQDKSNEFKHFDQTMFTTKL